jgi:hypothetical protein
VTAIAGLGGGVLCQVSFAQLDMDTFVEVALHFEWREVNLRFEDGS